MNKTDNRAVINAIKTAEVSLQQARNLLSGESEKNDLSKLKYIEGTFDGSHMVDASGKKYKINENYATKSMLVYGDKIRAYDEDGKYWFKQVDKVKRDKVSGMLTKKANVWHVVGSDGSYKVSPEAVEFLNLKINDDVDVFLPSDNKRVPFATLDFVKKVKKQESSKDNVVDVEKKDQEVVDKPAKMVKKETKNIPTKIIKKEKPKLSKKIDKSPKEDIKEKVVLEEDDLR